MKTWIEQDGKKYECVELQPPLHSLALYNKRIWKAIQIVRTPYQMFYELEDIHDGSVTTHAFDTKMKDVWRAKEIKI